MDAPQPIADTGPAPLIGAFTEPPAANIAAQRGAWRELWRLLLRPALAAQPTDAAPSSEPSHGDS